MTAKQSARQIDNADRTASHRLNDKRDARWMGAIGTASDIGDQAPMRLLCAAVIIAGMLRRDGKLARTGLHMLSARTLATWGKGRIKAVIDRTRPNREHDGYKVGPGHSHAHEDNSFPSGHSAGAVAVAAAYARYYPSHALAARAAAGAVAVAQIARGEHFIGDVLAGSLIGVAAEHVGHSAVNGGDGAQVPIAASAPFSVALPPSVALRTPPRRIAEPSSITCGLPSITASDRTMRQSRSDRETRQ